MSDITKSTAGPVAGQRRLEGFPKFLRDFRAQMSRQIMAWLGIAFLAVFAYYPMYGVIIAFKDYKLRKGILGSPWVGLKHFEAIFQNPGVWEALRNTLTLSFWSLIIIFPAPILLALLLNELHAPRYKRVVQTITYLPYFISWVIVVGLLYTFLEKGGLFNELLMKLGFIKEPIFFLSRGEYFVPTVMISELWKGIGWGSIIYLAAISGINMEIYEAAFIDGASRTQQVFHITLPSIKETIVILFIFRVSAILGSNFDLIYLLGNDTIRHVAETVDTYVFRYGLGQQMYSFATAAALTKSILAFLLLLLANFVSKKLSDTSVI